MSAPIVNCSSCGAPMFWAITGNGTRIPLDPEPVRDGNIEIIDQRQIDRRTGATVTRKVARVVGGEQYGLFPAPRYKSHFATCPNASSHRKARIDNLTKRKAPI